MNIYGIYAFIIVMNDLIIKVGNKSLTPILIRTFESTLICITVLLDLSKCLKK